MLARGGFPFAVKFLITFLPFVGPAPNGIDARWTGGRVAEGASLENWYRGNSIVGSNPTLSAIPDKIIC